MKINSLQLTNFRNYKKCQVQLSSGINVLLGENAQGKTNLLESLSFVSSLRSFRINNESQLIYFDKEASKIKCELEKTTGLKSLSVVISKEGKSLMINDTLIKKSSNFIGELNTVLFEPSDLGFFEDAPRVRRRFMDMELTKLSSSYLSHVNSYSRVLKQRNALLKQLEVDSDTLDILDQQLINHHIVIVKNRRQFIDFLNTQCNNYFNQLSKAKANLKLIYKTDVFHENDNEFKKHCLEKLKMNRQRDLYFKLTHFGAHRDDIVSLFNDIQLSQVASQGQKRLVILSMKLALIDYIHDKLNEQPVLLLDDVFSELDKDHQKKFIQLCPKDIQTIITTTDLISLEYINKVITIFDIKEGEITLRRKSIE